MNELATAGIHFIERGVEFRKWPAKVCADWHKPQADNKMTGDQSRILKVRARVRWTGSTTDLGTVASIGWGEGLINWDDGRTQFYPSQRYGSGGECAENPILRQRVRLAVAS
jgi:hypothetical protein